MKIFGEERRCLDTLKSLRTSWCLLGTNHHFLGSSPYNLICALQWNAYDSPDRVLVEKFVQKINCNQLGYMQYCTVLLVAKKKCTKVNESFGDSVEYKLVLLVFDNLTRETIPSFSSFFTASTTSKLHSTPNSSLMSCSQRKSRSCKDHQTHISKAQRACHHCLNYPFDIIGGRTIYYSHTR